MTHLQGIRRSPGFAYILRYVFASEADWAPSDSLQGMMIDEADEFVTGPQNKGKRPGDNNNVPGGGPKRRRCMSPLLRLGKAYTPPVTPPASPRHSTGDFNQDKKKNTFCLKFYMQTTK